MVKKPNHSYSRFHPSLRVRIVWKLSMGMWRSVPNCLGLSNEIFFFVYFKHRLHVLHFRLILYYLHSFKNDLFIQNLYFFLETCYYCYWLSKYFYQVMSFDLRYLRIVYLVVFMIDSCLMQDYSIIVYLSYLSMVYSIRYKGTQNVLTKRV